MMDPSAQIRPADFADLDAIVDLWGEMMDDHGRQDPRIRLSGAALQSYRAYVAYHLPSSDACIRVAERGGRIVGMCVVTISRNLPMFLPARHGYLSDLMVSPSCRRQGLGRALVRDCLAWLRAKGIDSVQLQFYCFNRRAEAFWRAMGFDPFYTRMWRDVPARGEIESFTGEVDHHA